MRYSASASSIQQSSNKTSSICPTRSDQNQHFHLNPADFQSWMIPFHSIQLSRHLFIIFQEFLFVLVYFFLFLSLSFFFLFEQTEEEGAGGVKCGWGKRERGREGESEHVRPQHPHSGGKCGRWKRSRTLTSGFVMRHLHVRSCATRGHFRCPGNWIVLPEMIYWATEPASAIQTRSQERKKERKVERKPERYSKAKFKPFH